MPPRRAVPVRLRRAIAERDGNRCAYCRSPHAVGVGMVVDHVIPLSAGGETDLGNLALACYHCNEMKGDRVSAVDPQSSVTVPLFNPCT